MSTGASFAVLDTSVWLPIAIAVVVVAGAVVMETVLAARVLNQRPDDVPEPEPVAPEIVLPEDGPAVLDATAAEIVLPDDEGPAVLDATAAEAIAALFEQLGERRVDYDEAERLAEAVAKEVTRAVGDRAGADDGQRSRFERALGERLSAELVGGERSADGGRSPVPAGGTAAGC